MNTNDRFILQMAQYDEMFFFSRKSYISTKVYIYYLELCIKLKVCILHTFQKFDENIEIKI